MFNDTHRNRSTAAATPASFAAVILVALASACGDAPSRDPHEATDDVREDAAAVDFGGLDSTEIRLHSPWSRNRVSKDPDPDRAPARLTAVTTEELPDYDRVVFAFEERVPGYRLKFVTEGGGGCDGTEAMGSAPVHLAVEFERAVSNDGGAPLVEDRDRKTRLPALAGATQSCDDGNKVRWLLAVRDETDYRFLELSGTPVLVVDLLHP